MKDRGSLFVHQVWIGSPSVLDPRPNFVFIILYFNDFENWLKRSKVITLTDGTVVYLAEKNASWNKIRFKLWSC